MRTPAIFLTLLLLAMSDVRAQPDQLPAFLAKFADSIADLPRDPLIVRGRVYVPAHSSLLVRAGNTRLELSVTLSIHNTSETAALVIERIDYFNVAGQLIEKYLPRAIALKPYGAIQIVIPQEDTRGGLGANFIVDWSSAGAIDEPYLEAIMIGGPGTQGYSLVSLGRKVSRP
ncbi:DUF3124 domain-containing protein [Bradyrhizobium macuxiense]|uniref:DUF3124 domain-containing protein n=1 Tax=Bradyrhizobium macuxiense TaxID=1755647 RepID=UPI0011BDCF87|nr:DUF3124 domain-containing protein [Bradyrhizobium macuxiense]